MSGRISRLVAALACVLLICDREATRGQESTLLEGEGSSIVDLDLSPDGKSLAATTDSGGVVLWDLTDGERTLLAANGTAKSVQFTSDGRRLLSGSAYEVVVWNLQARSGERVLSQREGSGASPMIASSDGRRVAVGTNAGFAFYDVSGDEPKLVVNDADGPAAIASAGDLAAIGAADAIRLFDLAEKKELDPIRGLPARAHQLAFHPNGKVLAVGLPSETQFWDVGRLPERPRLLVREPNLDGKLRFEAGGKLIVGVGSHAPQIWDATTRSMRAPIAGAYGELAVAADGSLIVAHEYQSRTVVADGATGVVRAVVEPDGSEATGAYAVSRDGSTVYIGLKSGNVRVLSSAAKGALALVASIELPNDDTNRDVYGRLDFLPGDAALLCRRSRSTAIVDLASGKATTLKDPDAPTLSVPIASFFVAPTEKRVVAVRAAGNGSLFKFDFAGRGERAGSPRKFFSLGASPDGLRVAAVVEEAEGPAQLAVLDAATGTTIGEPLLANVESGHARFAFSRDGNRLAAAVDRSARLWNLETGEETPLNADGDWARLALVAGGKELLLVDSSLRSLKAFDVESAQLEREIDLSKFHTGTVRDVAFSPIDPVFATVGDSGEVLLRDLATGDVFARVPGHTEIVWSVAFSSDGKKLATRSVVDAGATGIGVDLIKVSAVDYAALKGATPEGIAERPLPAPPRPKPANQLAAPREIASFDVLIDYHDYPKLWFAPGNDLLLAGEGELGYAQEIRGLDLATGKIRFTLEELLGGTVTFSPDGKYAVSPANPHAVSLRLSDGTVALTSENRVAKCSLALADNERILLGLDGQLEPQVAEPAIVAVDRETGATESAVLELRGADVYDLKQLPDGTVLASLVERGKLKVLFIDPKTLEPLGTLHEESGETERPLIVSPDGKFVSLGGYYVYTTDRAAPKKLPAPPGTLQGFIAGSNLAVRYDGYYKFTLHEPLTGTARNVLDTYKVPGGDRRASHFALSGDGRLLAWGTKEGEVVLCDLARGQVLPPQKLHGDDEVYAVGLSLDGALLASACADGKLKVWSLDGAGPAAPAP